MINATQSGMGRVDAIKSAQKDIQILDQTATMATVKVVSNDFVDYLHLARCDHQWKIINALWDYKTTEAKGTPQAARELVAQYADGWKPGQAEALKSLLLPDFAGRMVLSPSEVDAIDASWLVKELPKWKGDQAAQLRTVRKIDVLDASHNMASVKVSYDGLVEYLHLAFVGNQWYVVNSLRDFRLHPEPPGEENQSRGNSGGRP
jgi:hypothetical protein